MSDWDSREVGALQAKLKRVTQERDDALAVLADVDRESARIRQFGERVRAIAERCLIGDGQGAHVCCSGYGQSRGHDAECSVAELLRAIVELRSP